MATEIASRGKAALTLAAKASPRVVKDTLTHKFFVGGFIETNFKRFFIKLTASPFEAIGAITRES